jgi:hypothetical protein
MRYLLKYADGRTETCGKGDIDISYELARGTAIYAVVNGMILDRVTIDPYKR